MTREIFKTHEVSNLRNIEISKLFKNHIFQYPDKNTHILKDVYFFHWLKI